jgi:excisionase family DNA binding protein
MKERSANGERVYTTVQAAEQLPFSDDAIRRMCEAGRIEGAYRHGAGGHWRIPESGILKIKERLRTKIERRKTANTANAANTEPQTKESG